MKMRYFIFFMIGLLWTTLPGPAQSKIPDPLRFYAKYSLVWEAVRTTLTEMQMEIRLEDREAGKMYTRPFEFSNPTLASGDLAKFCLTPNLTDGNWVKARYEVESVIERLAGDEVQFTANVTVAGLKRNFQQQEAWVPCPSNGGLERRIYSKVGGKLLGGKFKPVEKKDFWDKQPQPVPGGRTSPEALPKPERRP